MAPCRSEGKAPMTPLVERNIGSGSLRRVHSNASFSGQARGESFLLGKVMEAPFGKGRGTTTFYWVETE